MQTESRINGANWDTINIKVLEGLPVYSLPPTYKLQRDSGNGCAGDPPGFPSYFTRSVYTSYGNAPTRGYSLVIVFNSVCYDIESANWSGASYEEHRAKINALMRRLWSPLPLDHPRTQAWIADKYQHLNHCYLDPALGKRYRWDKLLIYPVPDYKLRVFVDDKRFSHEWREKEKALINIENAEIQQAAAKIAVMDNHAATVSIREYYPEFTPTPGQVAGDVPGSGNWWETRATRPTPATCPGQYGHAHPVNGTWCQFCGYHVKQKAI